MGKIAIIGLGLIGGSMGLAIKRNQPDNTEVVGYDQSQEIMTRAHKAGVVTSVAPSLERAVTNATMVVVATPILTMRRLFREMSGSLQKGAIVTDTASTKADVLRWADAELPNTVHFVGGHPMAGSEKMGLQYAQDTLFDARPYCIVPSMDAIPGAVNGVVDLVQALGATAFFLDAEEHDSYAAAISHVPLLTSVALFNLAKGSNAWPELAGMSGPAFRDLTRLASGEPEMSHDIFLTNRANVLHWLNRYMNELRKLSDIIESQEDDEGLFRALAEAQIERNRFLEKLPEREDAIKRVELPTTTETYMTMITGSLVHERAREMTSYLEEKQKEGDEAERRRRRYRDLDDDE